MAINGVYKITTKCVTFKVRVERADYILVDCFYEPLVSPYATWSSSAVTARMCMYDGKLRMCQEEGCVKGGYYIFRLVFRQSPRNV